VQLQRGWQERQALIRQSALAEERRRIMRDMHDGIGGRLVSLAAQLQGTQRTSATSIDRQELASELLMALEDMRLIVDSLDTAGDDLGMALGAFRGRMEPRLGGSGLETHWALDDAVASLHLPAAAILDIYRILQEVFANVLRHARARSVSFRAQLRPDGEVWIDVDDDGVGIGGAPQGTGRTSMRDRASRHGASVTWLDLDPGTRVRLRLPPALRRVDTVPESDLASESSGHEFHSKPSRKKRSEPMR
jgi:signal transduction histidine kinase